MIKAQYNISSYIR